MSIEDFDNNDEMPGGEIVIFSTNNGNIKVQCRFLNQSIWLTQNEMAILYQTSRSGITNHIKHILEEGELSSSVIREIKLLGKDGHYYKVLHYNLEMIIAVGLRVRSPMGTKFRQWAIDKLHEYMLKGFVLDDERLKNPPTPDSGLPDYFKDMLARIRDIRASEKRVYLRVRELFALAGDYDPKNEQTLKFFAAIQNKMHFAVTGLTAAEIIFQRVNSSKPNLGLTTWSSDDIQLSDTLIAKNYLSESEIEELNRIVTMWLDFAEDQANRRKQIFLHDWEEKLDQFLAFNDRQVLIGYGKISKEQADKKARKEYQQFAFIRRTQREETGLKDNLKALEDVSKKYLPPNDKSNGQS